MTNAFYVALTFKLRTMGSADRAAQLKEAEGSPWEHLGVSDEDLNKAVAAVVGSADVYVLLPFAQRLWNEPVWEFKMAALKTLSLDHVEQVGALWDFVVDCVPQIDGPALAAALSEIGRKCLAADPERLNAMTRWPSSRHVWTRAAALMFSQAWAEEDRDPSPVIDWAATLADDGDARVQAALGTWLRGLAKSDATLRNAFLAEHGEKLSEAARTEAAK